MNQEKSLIEWKADFDSHPIVGFTNIGDHQINTSLFTQITDKLWMGGTPAMMGHLPPLFESVLNLYKWESYMYSKLDVNYRVVEMYDSLGMPDMSEVNEYADWVLGELDKGRTTLVHCQAGLNRSGLVTGVVLTKLGMDPEEAIQVMRLRRSPAVLCNHHFEAAILGKEFSYAQ